MGYYTTNTVFQKAATFGSTYPEGKKFVDFLKDCLVGASDSDICNPNSDTSGYPGAGWTLVDTITAQISFTALAIVDHVLITLNGTKFEFVADGHTPIHGGIPVPLGSDNDSSLGALGAVVSGAMQWEFSRPNLDEITFFKSATPKLCNGLVCDVLPSGSIGVWDTTTGVPGEGFTWRGGYKVQSALVNSNPLILKLMTQGNGSHVIISDANEIAIFDGLQVDNSWELLANKYQFSVRVPSKTSVGTFLIASHMKPLSNSIYFNFVAGPTGPIVGTGGGDRLSLQTLNGFYYVDWNGLAYFANSGIGTSNQRPALCYPGMSYGIANIDKLSNKIGGADLKRDDETFTPYEALLAVCNNSPASGGVLGIRGAFWDSIIYPTYATVESPALINGKNGLILFGQAGSGTANRGIFVTRTN